jgi:hypothetical protein
VDTAEALEEASFVLDLIDGYDIAFPVVFDWERIEGVTESRTYNTTDTVVTDCCLAFCDAVSAAGYEPAVYFYRDLGYNVYELDRLTDLKFWVGAIGDYPDFYYDLFHSKRVPPDGNNRGRYSNPDLDILLENGRNAQDPAVRKSIYSEVQRKLAEDLPYISFWHVNNISIVHRRVQGYRQHPTGGFQSFKGVTIGRDAG